MAFVSQENPILLEGLILLPLMLLLYFHGLMIFRGFNWCAFLGPRLHNKTQIVFRRTRNRGCKHLLLKHLDALFLRTHSPRGRDHKKMASGWRRKRGDRKAWEKGWSLSLGALWLQGGWVGTVSVLLSSSRRDRQVIVIQSSSINLAVWSDGQSHSLEILLRSRALVWKPPTS